MGFAHHLRDHFTASREISSSSLPFELGIEHLHRQHIRGARPTSSGHHFQPALAHRVQVDEILDGVIDAFAQAGDVGAPKAASGSC